MNQSRDINLIMQKIKLVNSSANLCETEPLLHPYSYTFSIKLFKALHHRYKILRNTKSNQNSLFNGQTHHSVIRELQTRFGNCEGCLVLLLLLFWLLLLLYTLKWMALIFSLYCRQQFLYEQWGFEKTTFT